MNEECIIRKLVADGDGTGDDRRFATMLPALLKIIEDPNSSQNLVPRILRTLDAAETSIKKQVLLSEMNERQIADYNELAKKIKDEIVEANKAMNAAKKELATAKLIRKNKEEYELLAEMIKKIPSRQETTKKLESVKKELEELHEKRRKLEAKLADRKNHLHAFGIILANFDRFLKQEEEMEQTEELDTDTENTVDKK